MLFNIKINPLIFRNHGIRFKSNYSKISYLSQKNIGESIQIKGWIKGLRKMKENIFVDINDGSCIQNLQVIVNKEFKHNLNHGASIETIGIICLTPKGQLELKADSIKVVGKCVIHADYPFVARQTYPPEYIRKFLSLRSRISSFNSMLRIRNEATKAINNYLQRDCIQIHTPIITSNDCEGAGEVFRVQPDNEFVLKNMKKENVALQNAYFDKKVYLTVSGQLHLEAMSHGVGNCYTFGPTFRAENSKSHVHLSEFYMLEVERCFLDSMHDLTEFIENMIKSVTRTLVDNCSPDMINCHPTKNEVDFNFENSFKWIDKSFPTITYKEAVKIIKKNQDNLQIKFDETVGFAKEHELFLVNYFMSPIFVVEWPKLMKPFYMRENKCNESMVDGFDLLVPFVGELAGGSIREDDYIKLKHKLPHELEWYLGLRKFGSITTGGFGMGFERYLQYILNITNIKDVIPFPRWAHNCDT